MKLRKEDDPFWDPIEAIYLGTSYLRLMGLAYLVDNQADLNIIGAEGGFGQLSIELYPTDILGTCNMAENIDTLTNYIEDPGDLIGRRLDFILKINSAIFPGNQYKDVFVEYELRGSDGKMESFRTNTIFGTKCHPKFRYSFHHVVEKLDGEGLEYLLNGEIGLRIFGVGERPCQTIKETMRINEDGSLIRRLKTSRCMF